MARNSRDLEKRSEIDPQDEPSAEWGWHGSFPKAKAAAGVVSALILVSFIFGPYQTSTQDLWIAGIVVLIALGLMAQAVRRRNAWRR